MDKFLFLVILTITALGHADIMTRLQDGTPVMINEQSRNVYFLDGGIWRPLWGGVHRLENGTHVTVQGGVLINEFGELSTQQPHPEESIGAPSRCEILVAQTCGSEDRCATYPGCQAARQLLQMEEKERRSVPSSASPTTTSCAEALTDTKYFIPCPNP